MDRKCIDTFGLSSLNDNSKDAPIFLTRISLFSLSVRGSIRKILLPVTFRVRVKKKLFQIFTEFKLCKISGCANSKKEEKVHCSVLLG